MPHLEGPCQPLTWMPPGTGSQTGAQEGPLSQRCFQHPDSGGSHEHSHCPLCLWERGPQGLGPRSGETAFCCSFLQPTMLSPQWFKTRSLRAPSSLRPEANGSSSERRGPPLPPGLCSRCWEHWDWRPYHVAPPGVRSVSRERRCIMPTHHLPQAKGSPFPSWQGPRASRSFLGESEPCWQTACRAKQRAETVKA